MSLTKLTRVLYKFARVLADIKAVRKGTYHKRLKNKLIKKML